MRGGAKVVDQRTEIAFGLDKRQLNFLILVYLF
jgi:hypothetical protein